MIFGSLAKFSLCPYYQTREAVVAAGMDPGKFDINKPGKAWILNPNDWIPDEDGFVVLSGLALSKDWKTPKVDHTGKPYIAPFKVPYEDLGSFNIPDKQIGTLPDQKVLKEYQLPLRMLFPNEKLDWTGFGIPTVVNVEVNPPIKPPVLPTADPVDFASEFEILKDKLDLILASLKG